MLSVVAAAAVLAARPCDVSPLMTSGLCDETKTHAERAAAGVALLTTLDQKAGLLQNTGLGVESVGIPAYQWWSEALHGVGNSPGVTFNTTTPYATSFPQVITTAASYNKTLYHTIAQTISTEARAFNNLGHAGLTFWTPNINLVRDPRWGRGQETPGEDPYLTSQYAESFVPGMQGDEKYIKASSCCKHFYGYDMEKWGGKTRHNFDAIINQQDEADTYFPAFHSCIRNAKASGLMCSYNSVNGIPSCANKRIMTDYARTAWGFEGYVTSDCGAVADVAYAHGYTTRDGAVNDTLTAGMDSDCGRFFSNNVKKSVEDNVTKEAAVDTALTNLFVTQLRLGMYDKASEQPYLKYTFQDDVNTPAHQELALEAARQGMVLLKNDGNTLPFSNTTVKTVAMVGPNANATTALQANYEGVAPYLISPVMGVSSYAKTTLNLGCADTACKSDSDFTAAVTAAKEADVTVMVMGMTNTQESEGHDRTDIAFPGKQLELVQNVTDAAKGDVVIVVVAGGSLDMTALKTNPKVKAIIFAGYPGQSGGQAIADVLFGTVNPGGRLPHTQYPADYITNLSMLDMGMRPNASSNNTGRTYRFYTGEPVYSFGEGMSYTDFTYTVPSGSSVDASAVAAECTKNNARKAFSVMPDDKVFATVSVTVTNTGSVKGDTVAMIFMKPPPAPGAPIKFLVGFERVTLEPGQNTVVQIPLYYTAFSLTNLNGEHEAVKGAWTLAVGFDDQASATYTIA